MPDEPVAEVQIKPEFEYDLVVWDLETTGLDPRNCEIIEIGAMMINGGEVVDTKTWVLNHGIEIPAEITNITGIDKAIIDAEGKDPKLCLADFVVILANSKQNLTHNGIKFDIPFLVESTKRHLAYPDDSLKRMRALLDDRAIDTAAIYKGKKLDMKRKEGQSFKQYADTVLSVIQKGLRYNVAVCCDDLGIDRASVTQHRVLGDMMLTFEIYKKLTI